VVKIDEFAVLWMLYLRRFRK